MELCNDRRTAKAVGVLVLVMGFICTYMGLVIAAGVGVAFLLFLALALFTIAIGAFTARYSVHLDRERGTLEKQRSTLIWTKRERLALTDFERVGIAMGGRSAAGGGSTTVYYVDMLGRKNVKLPGASTNLTDIEDRAREVADYLGLPLDAKPAAAFFGQRL